MFPLKHQFAPSKVLLDFYWINKYLHDAWYMQVIFLRALKILVDLIFIANYDVGSSVQSLSRVGLFAAPWTSAH